MTAVQFQDYFYLKTSEGKYLNVLDGEPVLSDSPLKIQLFPNDMTSTGAAKTTAQYTNSTNNNQKMHIYSIYLQTLGGYFIGSSGDQTCNEYSRRYLTTGFRSNNFALMSTDRYAPGNEDVLYGEQYIIRGTGRNDTKYVYSCRGTSYLFWSLHSSNDNDNASTRLEFTILKATPGSNCSGDPATGVACPEEFACTVVGDCGDDGIACTNSVCRGCNDDGDPPFGNDPDNCCSEFAHNGICMEPCTTPGNAAASVGECCDPLYYDGECVPCLPGGETKPASMTAEEACCSEVAEGDVCQGCTTADGGSPGPGMPCCSGLFHNFADDTCDPCVPNGQAPPEDMDECCGMNLDDRGKCTSCAVAGTGNISRQTQCCKGLTLVNDTCVGVEECDSDGEECTLNSCCDGYRCHQGFCEDDDACLSEDEECTDGDVCCGDMVCTEDEIGTSHCVPPAGPPPCGETGDPCADVDDCCDGHMCGRGGECKPTWYWGLYIGIIVGGLLLLAALVYAVIVLLKPKKADKK